MLSGLCVLFHRQLKLKGNTVNTNTFSTSQIVKWALNLISQYTERYQEFDGFYSHVIKLQSQNSEVLRILIYSRLKIN